MLFLRFHINMTHVTLLGKLRICTGERNCSKGPDSGRMTSVSGTHKLFTNQELKEEWLRPKITKDKGLEQSREGKDKNYQSFCFSASSV